jgi:hypothetical protein
MRLFTLIVRRNANIELNPGIRVFKSPFPHILVGEPNRYNHLRRIPIGERFYPTIPMEVLACTKNGDPTLGKCTECDTEILDKHLLSFPDGKMQVEGGEIDLFRKVAVHGNVPHPLDLERASVIVTKDRKAPLLVEERPENAENGRVGVLMHAEAGDIGVSKIEPFLRKPDPIRSTIHQKAIGSAHVGHAIWAHRLLILTANDLVKITRLGGTLDGPKVIILRPIIHKDVKFISCSQEFWDKVTLTQAALPPKPKAAEVAVTAKEVKAPPEEVKHVTLAPVKEPETVPVQKQEDPTEEPKKRFRFFWKDSPAEDLEGENVADALKKAGYTIDALAVLDRWEEIQAKPPTFSVFFPNEVTA